MLSPFTGTAEPSRHRKMQRVTAVILALVISTAAAAQWAKICSSESANKVRGCDSQGCGGYNYPRGGKKHRGVDVVCEDGTVVLAPFTGRLLRQAKPYGNGNAIDDGVQLAGSGFCIKMFYIKPVKYSGSIKKGEKIGILLPLQKVYRGIISHVHIQNCDLTDPTPYL
ncbi:leukocyte cell-derived chemotaxin-2-like [Indicator indicator]|uniref:leukocyte cell-derived chemotaxin-2-like n=1 Tax=Indicator indicator TaxID=1002788 RepID=UPI0023DEC6A7|nr:leukocyte cell-derived chemotaxin-2-like [Indicator indicator]